MDFCPCVCDASMEKNIYPLHIAACCWELKYMYLTLIVIIESIM